MSLSKATAVLTSPLRLLSNPILSGPLLYTLLQHPERLQAILPPRLHHLLASAAFLRALKILLTLSVVRAASAKLSEWQLNNWTGAAKFVKSRELVLVTGGSSGIGRLMAEGFVKAGARVVVVDLNAPVAAFRPGITFYQLDVTSSEQIAEVAKEIRKNHGHPTVLINNAGIGTCRTILGGKEEEIRKTFEVNTMSHFWMVREFLPAMAKANHGHVVTIASMASFVVHAQNVDYSCTKAAALAFHEGLASELKHRLNAPKVKTTVVHPAWIRTPMTTPLTSQPGFTKRIMEAEDVARDIVNQVLSGKSAQMIMPPEASFLTGIRGWPSWLQQAIRNKIGHELAVFKE